MEINPNIFGYSLILLILIIILVLREETPKKKNIFRQLADRFMKKAQKEADNEINIVENKTV